MDTAISRRQLVGSAVLGIAGASLFSRPAAAEEITAVEWDAECDVLVIGLGAAGATAAITAAAQGAQVLVVDKAPLAHVGGNSAVCMQYICCTDDVDACVTYVKAMRNGYITPSDEIIEAFAAQAATNRDFMVEMGATDPVVIEGHAEFPEFEGSDSLPYFTVDGTPGGNGAAYKLLFNACMTNDAVDIWYEAAAQNLIQDRDTKIVHGAEVLVDGQVVRVRAKNGVVLACGGYESNALMLQNYCMEKKVYSLGQAVYNTGDGVRMAQAVGADLWHMAHIVGHIDFVDEQTGFAPFRLAPKVANMGAIFVGSDGTRFMDETYAYRHGKYPFHGSFINLQHPEDMWMVFDQRVFASGPLYPTFSADNSAELEKGWIVEASTIEELAEKIGVDPAGLQAQIEGYNALCEAGEDAYYGRPADFLMPIDETPYYAMPLFQSLVNTQGGPARNERTEILDTNGDPIPHLYGCGELGDIWSCFYQAGCNFGGGIAWGRITGVEAAAVKDDVSQESLMGGRENYQPQTRSALEAYTTEANQYLGEGQGKSEAPIVVRVTLDNGAIADVEVLEHGETEGIGTAAVDSLPAAIVEAGSTDVDAVSGATLTSNGIKEAVENALAKTGDVLIDEREPQK